MTNNTLGLLMVVTAGVALISLAKTRVQDSRLVLSRRINPDGTCTYTYDDGTQEVGGCLIPPA